MEYRREIDGLRAISVVSVILFHASFQGFSGGFVGVDVFFVISGYLITGILMNDLSRGDFSIQRFYERRARRILPALTVVLVVTTVFACLWLLPTELETYMASLGTTAIFLSNFYFMSQEGYFGPAPETQPLLHTWSLAIEEQYYLFFPIILFLVWRTAPRATLWVLLALCLSSLVVCEISLRTDAERNFFFSFARFWELLVGSICAVINFRYGAKGHNVLALSGLALILYAVFGFDKSVPFPSLYTMVPVIGAALVLLYARHGTVAAQVLSLRPMVGIGLISYSAYLWHQPVLALVRVRFAGHLSQEILWALVLLSFGLAYLSWRWVEQPFRVRKDGVLLFSRKQVFAISLSLIAVTFGLGYMGFSSKGFDATWRAIYPDRAWQADLLSAPDDAHRVNPRDCLIASKKFNDDVLERITECSAKHGPGILVIGDSHSADVLGILSFMRQDGLVVRIGSGGCHPFSQKESCGYYEKIEETKAEFFKNFELLIYAQSGSYLFHTGDGELGHRSLFSNHALDEQLPEFELHRDLIQEYSDYLAALTSYVPVVWLGPRTEPHIPLNTYIRGGCSISSLRQGQAESFANLNKAIQKELADAPIGFVAHDHLFQVTYPAGLGDCDGLYWTDGDHISALGEQVIAERQNVLPQLYKLALDAKGQNQKLR